MARNIKDLTREDWNRLFPIALVNHNPEWKAIYKREKNRIIESIGTEIILRIEHFGGSSIPSIKSKPYIDLLIEVSKELLFDKNLITKFSSLGYEYFKVPYRENIEAYMSFGKGYNLEGKQEQIFHIHMCPKENLMWQQIDFRDYLNENIERAKQYEDLKIQLASEFKNDRGAYVLGKTKFIKETLDLIQTKKTF